MRCVRPKARAPKSTTELGPSRVSLLDASQEVKAAKEKRMDNTALQDLVAEVRSTIATLAEAEQKVAAAKAELGRHDHNARLGVSTERSTRPMAKNEVSGWVAA
jgi:hypothetical protein